MKELKLWWDELTTQEKVTGIAGWISTFVIAFMLCVIGG